MLSPYPLLPFLLLEFGQRPDPLVDEEIQQRSRLRLVLGGGYRWSRLTVGCLPAFRSASTA